MIGLCWDLDGTLIDSADDIAAAVDEMLVARGLPALGSAQVRAFIGDGASRLVDRCVRAAGGTPDPDHLARFLARYHAVPVQHTTVFPGILPLLASVAVPQAIVTNKPEGLSRAVLAALGLTGFFPVVIGGDTLPLRKPDPAPLRLAIARLGVAEAILIGDGPADVGAAQAAGVPIIGVDWGIAAPVGADLRCPDVASLRAALAERGVLR